MYQVLSLKINTTQTLKMENFYYNFIYFVRNFPTNYKIRKFIRNLANNFSTTYMGSKYFKCRKNSKLMRIFYVRFNASFYNINPNVHKVLKMLQNFQIKTFIRIRRSKTPKMVNDKKY